MNYLFNKKNWHKCEEKFWDNNNDNDRNKCKFRDHCHFTGKHRGAAYSICNLKYKIPEENPAVFENGSKYDYHFITRELAKEFEKQFDCLKENKENYITFSVPIKKENKKADKYGKEITKIISDIKVRKNNTNNVKK